jgi:hypothetical protein
VVEAACRWHDIFFPNIHAPTEDKINDKKDSVYKELKRAFSNFLKYHVNILLDFNVKVCREDFQNNK